MGIETSMKILVCGGRDYRDKRAVYRIMFEMEDRFGTDFVIIHGHALGTDAFADKFAEDFNHETEKYPANWTKHGKAAGFIRNQQMLDKGKPDLVVAFPGGKGTADMIARAEKAGIKILKVP